MSTVSAPAISASDASTCITPPSAKSWLAMLALLCGSFSCAQTSPPPPPPPTIPAPAPTPEPIAPAVVPEPVAPPCNAAQAVWPQLHIEGGPAIPAIERVATLAPFYDKVARLLRGKAQGHLRIAVYGDSNLTMDFMSGAMRRVLQGQFGDAGHGFVALARPWSHYKHMDVRHGLLGHVESYACSTHPTRDPHYGISCIVGESRDRNAGAWLGTAKTNAPIGTTANHFEVFYMRRKKGGKFAIRLDGSVVAELDSRSDAPALGHYIAKVDAGEHRLSVRAKSGRSVRWLGAVMENRGKPSFVVDAFGVGAMNTPSQARQGPVLSVPMLKKRNYDLIIFATGANDGFSLHNTPKDLATMLAMQREALPNTPIIFFTPSDRGKKKTFYPTYKVVLQRRELAAKHGVALWDLFEAMGGKNSMRGFRRAGYAKSDYTHMSQAGGEYLGHRFIHALWRGLETHFADHPSTGCDAPTNLTR